MKEKNLAKAILKRLFEGSRIEGIRFGPILQLLVTDRDSQETPIYGQIYLNLVSSWMIIDSLPLSPPNSEDDFPAYSEDEQIQLLCSLKNLEIVKIELGNKHPHLIFTFENGKIFTLNGIDYAYECWQAGVAFNKKESCQIIACPGGELAIWDARTFQY
ncbi:MAG TPA: hypothetical protein VIL74_12580 [Pyrinomonadaceae bacterium]|jgi:hypothetical protein